MTPRPRLAPAGLMLALLLPVPSFAGESLRLADGSILFADEVVVEDGLLRARVGELWVYFSPAEAQFPQRPAGRSALHELLDAAAAEDPETRRNAISGLAEHAEPKAREALIAALQDDALEVRAEAIRALADDGAALPNEQVVEIIDSDGDLGPRLAAIQVLAARGKAAAQETLARLLGDPVIQVRQAARSALRNLRER